ncbi:hypothetical protein RJ640_025575 [Escallonia rubra]|uniref:Protein kinase domain-containing protein n=1 Tax=Escallonia rubra TaxID=112253 RepID=A0AA88Q9D5_9ASTE|nr:hypothetical protein RJ640_025575 [Escallonia rubra]
MKKKMNEFKYEELEAATQNFSSSCLIGKGSHGCVYKGILRDGKLVVAIKRESLGLQELEDSSKLDNEVCIISSLPQSQYLINLLGTSHDSAENKALVMEHMPNGTLHELLHSASTPPAWPKRAQTAIQIARALQFLHESKPSIVHRDVKSANILFDSAWNAKLADFGLAVIMEDDSPSQPAGTIGYLDPCYTTPCKLSTKTDVFSFGVVLLEIISCTRAIDVSRVPASIVDWAMPLIKERRMLDICDKRITMPRYMEGTIWRMLTIAARCVSLEEDHRPSIGDIINDMENTIIERVRFPIWINVVQSLTLLRRRRKMDPNRCTTTTSATTSAITCAVQETNDHAAISGKKLLVREILADTT